jgi:hypothetical protein
MSFDGFDVQGGPDPSLSPLSDNVTEGNENFERRESENCYSENLKVKYNVSV